jgi:hypothetical protein
MMQANYFPSGGDGLRLLYQIEKITSATTRKKIALGHHP